MATRAAPPAAGLPAKVASAPPNQTLYVTNIPSTKIKKDDLRTELYLLFSTYGSVLDVVALKTMKMRGQAHIVYKDIQTATQAMRALERTWNHKFNYPWTFFNDVPFSPEFKKRTQEATKAQCNYGMLGMTLARLGLAWLGLG